MGTAKLTKCPVVDMRGKRLGNIEDIMVDTRTGCARYAVLAVGGVFGFGRRRYAVPWSALSPDAQSNRCVLDVGVLWLTASHLDDGGHGVGGDRDTSSIAMRSGDTSVLDHGMEESRPRSRGPYWNYLRYGSW